MGDELEVPLSKLGKPLVDRYGRRFPVGEDGEPVSAFFLADIGTRRFDLIKRSAMLSLGSAILRLEKTLSGRVYGPEGAEGSRVLRSGLEGAHSVLVALAQGVEEVAEAYHRSLREAEFSVAEKDGEIAKLRLKLVRLTRDENTRTDPPG